MKKGSNPGLLPFTKRLGLPNYFFFLAAFFTFLAAFFAGFFAIAFNEFKFINMLNVCERYNKNLVCKNFDKNFFYHDKNLIA